MERKVKFIADEYYHVFSRGVEKRKIHLDKKDYERFLALLYILNQTEHFHVSNFLNKGQKNILDLFKQERGKPLVSILAYSLMPNHFHLIIREIQEGGISKFLSKLLTAYSMYFNKRYERSGPLFVHPFRSRHIEDDPYFLYLFAYVHLNSLDLFEKDWKESGIKNQGESKKFLEHYRYSSYQDYCDSSERIESQIVDKKNAPEAISRTTLDMWQYEKWYDATDAGIKDYP